MKKIVSIIIAMTLILSLCPLTFAVDVSGKHNYVFTADALGLATSVNSGFPNYETVTPIESDKWGVACRYWVKIIDLMVKDKADVAGGFVVPIGDYCVVSYSSHQDKYQNACFGIKINVKKDRTYLPSLKYYARESAPIVDVYLVKEGTQSGTLTTADLGIGALKTTTYVKGLDAKYKIGTIDMWADSVAPDGTETLVEKTEDFDDVQTLEEGDYYLLFHAVGVNTKYKPITSYKGIASSPYTDVAMVGLNSFSLTPVAEDPIPADEFDAVEDTETITSYEVGTVSAVAYKVGTDAQDNTVTVEAKDNEDGTYTLNAPEYEGYNFLYWKKGLTEKKDVITYKPTGFVYAPTAGETNYLIAVYEKIDEETTVNKAEFYNANGQFIKSTDGVFPEEKEIPSMAGYGDATGWQCYTDGKTYGLDESVTPNGIMLFVADYEDTLDTVKVNDRDVPYGTEIPFTANPEEGRVFKCWTRTDDDGKTEIVSIEETYKFRAYENCTIKEVYSDGTVVLPTNTRKIVLDTFKAGSATALMAEFIGFKNDTVVEKGIMFGNNRIAMKSTGTQFTIIPDETGTYEGYAIVQEEDDSYTLITDGNYEKQ